MDSRASVPAFSQSKASFSAMPRSFMLFSNTDMISCGGAGVGEDREVTPGASQEEQAVAGIAGVGGERGAVQDRLDGEEALEGEGHIDFSMKTCSGYANHHANHCLGLSPTLHTPCPAGHRPSEI